MLPFQSFPTTFIPYFLDGIRKQVRRATLADAKQEAGLILTELAQGARPSPSALRAKSAHSVFAFRGARSFGRCGHSQ